jgi:hypothetical protein
MSKTEAGSWISAEPMVEWTPPDLSELDHAISILRHDDEYGLYDGLIRFRDKINAACRPVPVSAPPPMESLGRNGDPKIVASVVFDPTGKPTPVWHMGNGNPGTIVYLAEHEPDADSIDPDLRALYDAAQKGFHTSESGDGYRHVSKFRTLEDMQEYGRAWTRAMIRVRDANTAEVNHASVAADDARAVLQELLDHVDETTCTHESTHRGGAIWTICDNCHAKWADDRGGFKPHEDAPAVAKARELLASEPPSTTDATAWIRYCSDGTYEGPIHDSQMDDIRRKSGAWTPLGRLHSAPPNPDTEDHGSIAGVVDSIGNDETGRPRILISTTRDQIRAFGPNLLFRSVAVRLAETKEVE